MIEDKSLNFFSFAKSLTLVGISIAPIWNLVDTPITNIGQILQVDIQCMYIASLI